MTNFEFVWELIPGYLQKENNKKLLMSICKSLDYVEKTFDSIDKMWLISDASGDWLDLLGVLLKTPRKGMYDELYRKKLKSTLYSYYFVPTVDNFIQLVEGAMGYSVENLKEGWKYKNESGLLECDVVVPIGQTRDLLSDLQQLYTAGCRLEYNKLQESFDLYSECSLVECGVDPIMTLVKRVPIPYIDSYRGYQITGQAETGIEKLVDITINGGA